MGDVTPLPLSYAQQAMWLMNQIRPGDPFYNIATAYRITGELDVPALRGALSEIVFRHEAIRTRFVVSNGTPEQEVIPPRPVDLTVEDLGGAADPEAAAFVAAAAEATRAFDLSRGPLLRARLLRLGPDDYVLLLTMHHIVTDAWSTRVFDGELGILYGAFAAGSTSPLPAVALQYGDFAVRQRVELSGRFLDDLLSYWREQLRDLPATLDLPADRPAPAEPSHRAETLRFRLPEEVVGRLRAICAQWGTTLFTALLAGFEALLGRLADTTDVAVRVPVAGRPEPELEELVGCFVNTLVLRLDCGGDPSFDELVRRAREVTLDGLDHQDLPFDLLVEELRPAREAGRPVLTNVGFQLLQPQHSEVKQAGGAVWSLSLPGLWVRPFGLHEATARLDLELHCVESEDGIEGQLYWAVDLFDRARMQRLPGQFMRLLDLASSEPERPLSRFSLLSDDDWHEQVVEWNDTAAPLDPDLTVIAQFERRVAERPDAVAVSSGDEQLTYAELNDQANRLAHHLSALGAGPEVHVGLCLERGVNLMVALLGIMKSGAAYVPMDPDHPADRLAYMMQDADCGIVLTRASLGLEFNADHVVRVDADRDAIARQPGHDPAPKVRGDNIAYAIYTSGSTGRPKGVDVPHRCLTNVIAFQSATFGIGPSSRVLQYSSVCFDASVSEIWISWTTGAELVVGGRYLVGGELAREVTDRGVTHLAVVPSVLATLPDAGLPLVRSIVIGGEPASSEVVNRWSPGHRLFNVYGPTETTVDATIQLAPGPITRTLPIGRPIANSSTYLLDARLQVVPVGVPGEGYIGGAGVSRGYRSRPGLTAARFLPDPFGPPGSRMYRSGDLARYLPDGSIEFLGRVDDQVKIRGFRVELGEVATVLADRSSVRQVAVGVRTSGAGDPRLVAYVVPVGPRTAGDETSLAEEHVRAWRQRFDIWHRERIEAGVAGDDDPATVALAERIEALKPRRVLEIGVGAGALLRRLAPARERYVATDFSQVAVDHLRFRPEVAILEHVLLRTQEASAVRGFEPRSFDVVVFSVARYLPGVGALDRLTRDLSTLVDDGGAVVLTNVRPLDASGDELGVAPGHFRRLASALGRPVTVTVDGDTIVLQFDQEAVEADLDLPVGAHEATDPLALRRAHAFWRELAAELRAHTRRLLPDYMVPSDFVVIDELPLTANGKIDLRALATLPPVPEIGGRPPADRREAHLCRVFAEVLERDEVGANDSFFDLGGQSLLAIRLLNRVAETTGMQLPLGEFFRRPTPAGLAMLVTTTGSANPIDGEKR